METLRLVDVADDGQLVLMSRDGTRYLLPVDAEVRGAVRRDRVRPAEEDRPDRPGPREVQARIRAGADAHEVAAATGLDLDYVHRFEGPVLAERRHVAELARSLPVHRDPGARPASLESVVLAALSDAGHDPDRVAWDSRRVEGTRWDVEVVTGPRDDAAAGPVRATWRIDVATRALDEVDEAARRLTALERRRLSPVRDRVFDIEAGRSRRQQAPADDSDGSATASILEALALQRGRRPGEVRDGERQTSPGGAPGHAPAEGSSPRPGAQVTALAPRPAAPGDGRSAPRVPAADEVPEAGVPATEGPAIEPSLLGELDLERPEPAPPVRPARVGRNGRPGPRTVVVAPSPHPPQRAPAAPEPAASREPETTQPETTEPEVTHEPEVTEPTAGRSRSAEAAAEPTAPGPAASEPTVPEPAAPEPAAARRGTRRRRAAVPSWDDIVFGARVDDD
ncbi:MAG: septation protein SepH [Kineosporiaceae bacterium]